eukprot:COSAG03_NODE_798_length_5810_cov_4.253371_7_plen_116_part_01
MDAGQFGRTYRRVASVLSIPYLEKRCFNPPDSTKRLCACRGDSFSRAQLIATVALRALLADRRRAFSTASSSQDGTSDAVSPSSADFSFGLTKVSSPSSPDESLESSEYAGSTTAC